MVKKRMEDNLRIHLQNYRLHDGRWLKCIPDKSIKDAILDIYNYTQTPAFSNVSGQSEIVKEIISDYEKKVKELYELINEENSESDNARLIAKKATYNYIIRDLKNRFQIDA